MKARQDIRQGCGGWWLVECSCGWTAERRAPKTASKAAERHMIAVHPEVLAA